MIKKLIQKFKTDRFYIDSIILTGFTVLGNLFAFLVNIIYTRLLPPGQYGAVMSINSMVNILGTMAIALRMFNVRETSEMITQGQTNTAIKASYKFTMYSFIAIMIIFILLLPIYPLITTFMNIDYFPLIISLGIVLFTYLSSIVSSIFQSMKLFLMLGIVSFVYPSIRFILTYPSIIIWQDYNGAVVASYLGITISFVLSSIFLLRYLENSSNTNNQKIKLNLSYFSPLLPIVLINLLYSTINFGDVIFARRYFNEVETDIFAIASTIAKANTFVIFPISYIVLPRMIEDFKLRGYKSSIMALVKGVILGTLASIAYFLFILIFGDIILKIFGERYLEAKKILPYFTVAFIPISLSFILINYSITFKNWYFIIPLVISNISMVGGFILFHNTFEEMITVILISGSITLVSLLLIVVLSKEPKIEISEEEILSEETTQT